MEDTTNNEAAEPNAEDVDAVTLKDGRVLTVVDLVKVYEDMSEEQKMAVHFLVNAAQNGEIELAEEEPADLEEEVSELKRLMDTMDKAEELRNE